MVRLIRDVFGYGSHVWLGTDVSKRLVELDLRCG